MLTYITKVNKRDKHGPGGARERYHVKITSPKAFRGYSAIKESKEIVLSFRNALLLNRINSLILMIVDEQDARSISRPRNVNIISHDPSDLNPEILASQRQTGTNHVSFVSEPNTSVSNLHINVHLESQIGSYSVNPANESDNLNSGDDTTYSPKHWDPPPYDSLFPVQDDPDSAKM